MCRSSTSTMGSIMTATTTAAANQESGRWAETNTRCTTSARAATTTAIAADRVVIRAVRRGSAGR